jgi:hypothetical protein
MQRPQYLQTEAASAAVTFISDVSNPRRHVAVSQATRNQ